VRVDLAGGTVTVTSEAELERATVRSAVEDAGYELG
jgi:copper chaperone CopZ